MADETFGKLLRTARKEAGFHTIAAFTDALSERGLAYTDDAIGHWENDRRHPYSSDTDRPKVMQIFQLLVEKGGIENTIQIDAMLMALNRPVLSNEEKAAYFTDLCDMREKLPNGSRNPHHRRYVELTTLRQHYPHLFQAVSG